MPYLAAWRDLVGLFGGRPRYSRFSVLGEKAFCAATDDRLLYQRALRTELSVVRQNAILHRLFPAAT